MGGHFYLQLSGPSEIESHWYKNLAHNESIESVKCAVGSVTGSFDKAMGELTKYRRKIRRRNKDNQRLAVIFNDYMNCLWGDPTSEKEFPLVDAAAEAGCEYFCIDAGWYADGFWWDEVGEWKESRKRFPNGVKEVADYIRKKGMIPGLWLEIEVMGIKCPLVDSVCDDSWFFTRHGKRVYDRSRYQLDFRNPKVRSHADEVIDRLVSEYGIGYIKMDYNIEPGIGTEQNCDSVGEGLWGHEKAYLEWLDGVFARHLTLLQKTAPAVDSEWIMRCFQDTPFSPHQIRTITKNTAPLRRTPLLPFALSNRLSGLILSPQVTEKKLFST